MFSSQIKYNKKTLLRFNILFSKFKLNRTLDKLLRHMQQKSSAVAFGVECRITTRTIERAIPSGPKPEERPDLWRRRRAPPASSTSCPPRPQTRTLWTLRQKKPGLICFRRKTLDLMTIENINDYKDNEGLPF